MNGALADTLAGMSRDVEGLLPLLHSGELIAAQQALEVHARKVLAAQVELDAVVEHAGLLGEHGYASLRGFLTDTHRLTTREAKARAERCTQVATRRSLTGEVLPPRLPETARALADGAIGPAHVEVIAAVLHTVADRIDPGKCAIVEEHVARYARAHSPQETKVLANQLLARLDPDGPEPADPDQAPLPVNTVHYGRARDGRFRLTGVFDALGEATLREVLDALAKPTPPIAGCATSGPSRRGRVTPLVDAMAQVLGCGDLPDCGGERPHVNVTVDLDDLREGLRGALLDYGQTLHPETARMMACDAGIIPVVLKGPRQPLDLGRQRRTLNSALRRALVIRAGGCCEMPGCDGPASWSAAHHIWHWSRGGPTVLWISCCCAGDIMCSCTGPDGISTSTPTDTRCSLHPHS